MSENEPKNTKIGPLEKPRKVWGRGPVRFGDVEIDCYVLDDGTPVLSKGKMMLALDRKWKGSSRSERPNFIGAMNLQPFVRPELDKLLEGMEFLDGGKRLSGYDAKILPHICKLYRDAAKADVLRPNQMQTAQKCEILSDAFSIVGITALIYEQLGYEKVKNPDAFRYLIESYLEPEIRKWSKEFPDEFFSQLDRIYGNQHTTPKNRPQYYAKFIRKYVYDPLEKGAVLRELDARNPVTDKGYRKHRHHSGLSEKVGLPALRAMVWQVIGALKLAGNKRKFEGNYARMMGQAYQTDIFEAL